MFRVDKDLSDLNKSHFAFKYLSDRGITDLSDFYFCPSFMKWTNQHKKVFKNIKNDEPRIIIPLRDEKGLIRVPRTLSGEESVEIYHHNVG